MHYSTPQSPRSTDDLVEAIARKCERPQKHAHGWQACCPAHDDRQASLSLDATTDRVLLHCHAGCTTQAVVEALGLTLVDLFPISGPHQSSTQSRNRIVATYDYTDARGEICYQAIRFEPKSFRQRRPDPARPGEYLWNLTNTRLVLYRLPEVLAAIASKTMVILCEGEKDVERLRALGLVATCNPMGAGKWREEYSETLRDAHCVILPDNDDAGRAHATHIARSLSGIAASVKLLAFPDLPLKGDVSDWLAQGGTRETLEALIAATPPWIPAPTLSPSTDTTPHLSPWDKAIPVGEFLEQEDPEYQAYVRDLVVPGSITMIAAPRGTGKSITALALAVALASAGKFRNETVPRRRVLLIDRDNPPAIVRTRLRNLDAKTGYALDVLTRDNAPPLSDHEAWECFPVEKYDVIVIDSLGAATEGISEKEGKQTQQFLATLKNLAHRGPSILALDNTNKAATSYRGRGEKADAVDILYEARDITGWTPPTAEDWWEHLPEYGDHTWQSRATRRKGQAMLGIAFIPSKYRLGIEPEPFAIEIDTRSTPWSLTDITNVLATRGKEAAREQQQQTYDSMHHAVQALVAELHRRADDAPIVKRDAIALLRAHDLTRRQARTLLEETYNNDVYPGTGLWFLTLNETAPGKPVVVRLVRDKTRQQYLTPVSPSNEAAKQKPILAVGQLGDGQNTPPIETSNGADSREAYFGRGSVGQRPKSESIIASNHAGKNGSILLPHDEPIPTPSADIPLHAGHIPIVTAPSDTPVPPPLGPDSGGSLRMCPQCGEPLRVAIGGKGVYCLHCRYRSLVSP